MTRDEVPPIARPRLLDLCCGAGGVTKGYQRAGFYVVGVDSEPQPHYCGDEFHQADALTFPLDGFDVIHASPPCQFASRATAWRGARADHPNLIPAIRARLLQAGVPYVIENVQEARSHLRAPIMLCGSQLGVPTQSHRYFEVVPTVSALSLPCRHRSTDVSRDHGAKQPESVFRDAIGCGWMTVREARQAIPPAYTEWIGRRILERGVEPPRTAEES